MSELRPSTPQQRRQLKAISRRLIEMAGGVSSFEHATRVKAPALSKYCSPDDELHMPADVLLDLMLDTGSIAPLSHLAEIFGYKMVALDAQPQSAALPNISDIALLMRDGSNVADAISQAVADGHISPAEARKISDFLEHLITDAQALQRKVKHAVSGGDA